MPSQLAKGTGTEFLTPAKEIQDALVQGLKDAEKSGAAQLTCAGAHTTCPLQLSLLPLVHGG